MMSYTFSYTQGGTGGGMFYYTLFNMNLPPCWLSVTFQTTFIMGTALHILLSQVIREFGQSFYALHSLVMNHYQSSPE